jgi:hypothetical protein
MEAKFTNGSTVTRLWDDQTTELIAAFQYELDAIRFANQKLLDETKPGHVRYLVYCHHSAKATILKKPPPEEKKKAA